MKNISIILLSGGMDSAVCAAIAHDRKEELACLHLNYGQRTQQRELQSFHDLCDYYQVKHRLVVDARHLAIIGGSSLTDTTIAVEQADLNRTTVPSSYVPFRNANILSMATSWAEVLGANRLYVGAVEEDSSGYPDCRESFFETFQQVIRLGTKDHTQISIQTPVIHLSKADIVHRGLELHCPFHLTWSCYASNEPACGRCDSCALRLRGFENAGQKDPLNYLK